MSDNIILEPSDSLTGLVDAIKQANDETKSLHLMPGTHYTLPGRNTRIKINTNGIKMLGIGSKEDIIIKRPDHAIDAAPDGRPDFNYGLFFIPADPTADEITEINDSMSTGHPRWKKYEGDCGVKFWYATIMRGKVEMDNISIDCNMHNQELAEVYSRGKRAEHSCMIGFSGEYYIFEPVGDELQRRIYIGFESVSISNVLTLNGGYADDIWCSRGYFYPNVGTVSIDHIQSLNRINPHRATISFSGLAKNINISNADIYRLECEETSSNLRSQPMHETFAGSTWTLRSVITDYIDIAAKGHLLNILGDQLETKRGFNLYEATGYIKRSTFRKEGQDARLFRLNHFLFQQVTWIFTQVETGPNAGRIMGIRPTPQYGEPTSVRFLENKFLVEGPFTRGQLIDSEFSKKEPGNIADIIFENCIYDDRFGTADLPVAIVKERGTWTFKIADFGDRDRSIAVVAGNPEYVTVVWI